MTIMNDSSTTSEDTDLYLVVKDDEIYETFFWDTFLIDSEEFFTRHIKLSLIDLIVRIYTNNNIELKNNKSSITVLINTKQLSFFEDMEYYSSFANPKLGGTYFLNHNGTKKLNILVDNKENMQDNVITLLHGSKKIATIELTQ